MIEITAMIEVMPMMIPKSVRNERSLLACRESKATPAYSRNPAWPARFAACELCSIAREDIVSIGYSVIAPARKAVKFARKRVPLQS